MCQQILASQSIVIRQLAHVIGKLVASELGVQFAPLYYKSLEIEKDRLLKQNFGDYEARVSLSPDALITIQWWVDNVNNYPRKITRDKSENSGECIQWQWSDQDKEARINFNDCHVRVCLDNTVAVTKINKMGEKIETLKNLTKLFWEFCMKKNIWVTASQIAGVENPLDDKLIISL